jgi:hypothetical protein
VYICARSRRQQQAGSREAAAIFLVERDQPILLAGGVGVVALGRQAGLHDLVAELRKRAYGVQDHRRALEELGQCFCRMLHFDHVVARGLDAGDVGLHRGVQLVAAAPGGDERDVVFAQVLAYQAARVAGGAVNHDGFLAAAVAHGDLRS